MRGGDWRIEWRNQRRWIALFPAAKGLSEHLFAVLGHLGDDGARSGSFFMLRAPYQQVKQNRRQGNALGCEAITGAAAVFRVWLGGDDSSSLKPAQPVGKYVGGNAFAGALKLAEGAVAAHHHVANQEQRPAIAE